MDNSSLGATNVSYEGLPIETQTARKSKNAVFIALIFFAVQIMSLLTPPFQSPDEYAHVHRAYLLSKGDVFLGRYEAGNATGGKIDTGLLEYMSAFTDLSYAGGVFNRQNESMLNDSKKVRWSGERTIVALPNTATYFPLAYLPQALAIYVGEHVGLSVHNSYFLARQFAIFTAVGVLWAAMTLCPVPLSVLALFAMPMALMQFASASLDGVAFALTAYVAAGFWRMMGVGFKREQLAFWLFIFAAFALITTRVNLLPFTFLPLVIFYKRRNFYTLAGFLVLVVASLAWVAFTVRTVHGVTPLTFSDNLIYELVHPVFTVKTIFELLPLDFFIFEVRMFIGVVGWHFIQLRPFEYLLVAVVILLVVASESWSKPRRWTSIRAWALIFFALASSAMILMIFLATNPLETPSLGGLQGRYFIPPAIFFLFAFAAEKPVSSRIRFAREVALYALLVVSTLSTAFVLLDRYWLVQENANRVWSSTGDKSSQSIPLSNGHSFSQYFIAQGSSAAKLSLLLESSIPDDTLGLRVSFFNDQGVVIYAVDRTIKHIGDKRWVDVPLNYYEYRMHKGERYKMEMMTLTDQAGAVRINIAAPSEKYSEGAAIVDGAPIASFFNFKMEFVK